MLTAFVFVLSLLIARTQQLPAASVRAEFGQDAVLTWELPSSVAGVAQVMVSRRAAGDASLETVATFSRKFGREVAEAHAGRVEWRPADMLKPSIRIHNVTWSDEACYICTFHVYVTGSQDQTTCLTVQGVSNVSTDVEVTGHDEMVVSCSATGKPAPEIRWRAAGIDNTTETASHRPESNADGTFTVNSTLTLLAPVLVESVECVVEVAGGSAWQERITLPSLLPEVLNEKETGHKNHAGVIAGVIAVCVVIFIATVAALRKTNKLQPLIQKSIYHSSLTILCPCQKRTSNRGKRSGVEDCIII